MASKKIILRFIWEEQLEESSLFWATVGLPMETLGKESALKQLSNFGVSCTEVRKLVGVPMYIWDYHPGGPLMAKLFCLT